MLQRKRQPNEIAGLVRLKIEIEIEVEFRRSLR
jgi:hypothetical protein